jgi:hypothetical protein
MLPSRICTLHTASAAGSFSCLYGACGPLSAMSRRQFLALEPRGCHGCVGRRRDRSILRCSMCPAADKRFQSSDSYQDRLHAYARSHASDFVTADLLIEGKTISAVRPISWRPIGNRPRLRSARTPRRRGPRQGLYRRKGQEQPGLNELPLNGTCTISVWRHRRRAELPPRSRPCSQPPKLREVF